MILTINNLFISRKWIFLKYKQNIFNIYFPYNTYNLINKIKKNLFFINISFFYNIFKLDIYNLIYYSHYNYYKKNLNNIIKYFTFLFIYFWLKITFKGKGFRVRKFLKSKKMTFNFGHSHWTKIFFNNNYFYIRKIRRQNYILISIIDYQYQILSKKLKLIKLINHYTKRGLRLKKQLIRKRFGKISQMISSLHF